METQRSLIVVAVSCLLWAGTALAERSVARGLLPVLEAAETALLAGDTDEALSVLDAYEGPEDPLSALLRGHSLLRAGDPEQARAAYERALALDPGLRHAALGLAQCLIDGSKHKEAVSLLSKHVSAGSAKAKELALYARAAFGAGDLRLASLLVERGILRFPDDEGFRRLDIAVLMGRGQDREAFDAALSFVQRDVGDAVAWRQLAAIAQEDEDLNVRLSTLEAAVMTNPTNARLVRNHVIAQFQAGHLDAALSGVQSLIAAAPKDISLTELGVRIADEAGALDRAQTWIASIPMAERSEALHLLEARILLRTEDSAQALAPLERLIRAGRASASVLLWAGQLAERARDYGKAEALYTQAAESSTQTGVSTLYLARLLHQLKQTERATRLLLTYLAKHPSDNPARNLLAVIADNGKTQ